MNKHTKTAMFVAPFLLIGGYVLSDLYLEQQAQKNKVIALDPVGVCDVLAKSCVVESGELKINIYQENENTIVNSTYALDEATLFILSDIDEVPAQYSLSMSDSPFYWQTKTKLTEELNTTKDGVTLRIIAKIKGGHYISEVYTQKYN